MNLRKSIATYRFCKSQRVSRVTEEFSGNVTLQHGCGCSVPCSLTEYSTRLSTALFPAMLYDDWIKATFGYTHIR